MPAFSEMKSPSKTFVYFQVYIKTYGEHVGFRIFMDAILLSLTRKVSISVQPLREAWA